MSQDADIDQARPFAGDDGLAQNVPQIPPQGLMPNANVILSRLRAAMGQARKGLVDFLLPPRCAACHKQTTATGAVCAECWRFIDFIEAPICARLGTPFPDDEASQHTGEVKHERGSPPKFLSAEAIARPPVFDRARAVALYSGPARKLVTTLKFGDRTDHAPLMGRWMARAGGELIGDADIIAPVPLHHRRLLWRKHNQSALLANAIQSVAKSELLPNAVSQIINIPDLLVRTRPTRAQVGLSARQRAANVRGALKVADRHCDNIRGKRILLIDDVYTTGATVSAASQALLSSGASAVDVLTFARVVSAAQLPI